MCAEQVLLRSVELEQRDGAGFVAGGGGDDRVVSFSETSGAGFTSALGPGLASGFSSGFVCSSLVAAVGAVSSPGWVDLFFAAQLNRKNVIKVNIEIQIKPFLSGHLIFSSFRKPSHFW